MNASWSLDWAGLAWLGGTQAKRHPVQISGQLRANLDLWNLIFVGQSIGSSFEA